MLGRLLVTDDSKATAVLRLVLGVVFFAHGAQKLLGWYGGVLASPDPWASLPGTCIFPPR